MMLTQSTIKLISSLKEKKFRDAHGLFAVEGDKLVAEALKSSFEVVEVFRQSEIGESAMKRISLLSTPSPSLALVRKPSEADCREEITKGGLYLALDSLRDPGNMGTILRLADWFGVDEVFASSDSVDIYNPKVVQSTMGAIFRIPFHYCSLPSFLRKASKDGATVFGTFLHGENIYEASLQSDGARIVVTGNEANGISDEVAAECGRRITIPSFAKGSGSESLNAAIATAITISEFRRR